LAVQINEFVKLGGDQLVPYYADILGAILPCISDKEEKIRVVGCFSFPFVFFFGGGGGGGGGGGFIFLLFFYYYFLIFTVLLNSACNEVFISPGHLNTLYFYKVARETNEELRSIKADPPEGFDVGPILTIAKRCCFQLEKKLRLKCN
jgi:hypothetical protein